MPCVIPGSGARQDIQPATSGYGSALPSRRCCIPSGRVGSLRGGCVEVGSGFEPHALAGCCDVARMYEGCPCAACILEGSLVKLQLAEAKEESERRARAAAAAAAGAQRCAADEGAHADAPGATQRPAAEQADGCERGRERHDDERRRRREEREAEVCPTARPAAIPDPAPAPPPPVPAAHPPAVPSRPRPGLSPRPVRLSASAPGSSAHSSAVVHRACCLRAGADGGDARARAAAPSQQGAGAEESIRRRGACARPWSPGAPATPRPLVYLHVSSH